MDQLGLNLTQSNAIEIEDPELWDPEIVAALEDDAQIDEDPDNQLDDDFVSKAIGNVSSSNNNNNSGKKKNNVIIIKENNE